ncbi:AAA family ATPase [Ktedonosporobacter rubrisoli]|uniref:AAA family ATPase n=1 Tax=Ktedonosporobacter rubrisoli TaxID=2509675 RepID=UPI001A91E488|nr:AAA family ATPase [Ktedonosporobacter rubrisoli]
MREKIKTAGRSAILAVVAPKNDEDEQALEYQLFAALGVQSKGHWRTRKPRLMGHLHQSGTQCLVMDDAHDLSLKHLMFLKELIDQGHLQYDHPFGVCLVAAGRGNTIPLKEYFDQPKTTWQQFFRRLDQLEPYCRIEGHTSEEVREILAALEKVYTPVLPQLNLLRSGSSIYTWLPQPVRVECPGRGRVCTLSPRGGVLHFKSHDKRKMTTPNTGQRWAKGEREMMIAIILIEMKRSKGYNDARFASDCG